MIRKRILFVDDEPSLTEGLQNILRRDRHEWEMVFAPGGEAALAELAKASFDVVVSDMRMPGMDGASLLGRVKEQYPHAARIMLSGYADREAVLRAMPVAHQYLSKPCDAEVLRGVIDQTCKLQALLHDEPIRAVIGTLDRLPSVPACHTELTAAVTNADSGLADLARIVERDPAMSAKVLQLVNSAYFGSSQRITSVQRAVIYLGIECIQGLALTRQVFDTLRDRPIGGGVSLDALQEHSLLTARLAKRLIRDPLRGDEAFAVAIVHDIGKIILALGCPDRYIEIVAAARRERRPVHQVEKEILGVSHAEAGAYLLGVWGLPFSIVEAVAFHHTPSLLTGGGHEVVAAVHVADALVHAATDEFVDEWDLLDPVFLEENGLVPLLPQWKATAMGDLRDLLQVQ